MKNELEKLSTAIQLSKSGIADQVSKITAEVEEGNLCPLKVQALAKGLEELAKQLKSATAGAAVEEAAKYGKGEKITALGCTITPRNSTRYSYTGAAFEEIEQAIKPYKDLEKQLQEAAKTAAKNNRPLAVIVTEDGEQIEVPAAISSSTDTVAVSLKKD